LIAGSKLPNLKFSHFPGIKRLGIQVHSSKMPNVVLFSVVRLTSRDETNLLILKHLQSALPFSTAPAVETLEPGSLVLLPSVEGLIAVGQFNGPFKTSDG
jgi:hypothetical protein